MASRVGVGFDLEAGDFGFAVSAFGTRLSFVTVVLVWDVGFLCISDFTYFRSYSSSVRSSFGIDRPPEIQMVNHQRSPAASCKFPPHCSSHDCATAWHFRAIKPIVNYLQY